MELKIGGTIKKTSYLSSQSWGKDLFWPILVSLAIERERERKRNERLKLCRLRLPLLVERLAAQAGLYICELPAERLK